MEGVNVTEQQKRRDRIKELGLDKVKGVYALIAKRKAESTTNNTMPWSRAIKAYNKLVD